MGVRQSKESLDPSGRSVKHDYNSRKKDTKRVCIVGGGAAGMACAWSLSLHPDTFDVEVWEALPEPGGVASTCEIRGGEEINDQVQGGAPSYRNNLLFFSEFGFEPHDVDFKISFGKGDYWWSNHGHESDLVKRLAPEIKRFGKLLRWINRFELFFIFVSIESVLKFFRFDKEFQARMVFPLTALFFGTGNQTHRVSAAIIARVFLDPQLRLFQYSPTRLLDEVPKMFAFPKLREIFSTIAETIPARVRTNLNVIQVYRSDRIVITAEDKTTGQTVTEIFDEIIFACGAEESLRALGDQSSWLENKLLSNVRYYNDLIVTHEDENYMKTHYQFDPVEDMYFVRCDEKDPRRIEMSFNLAAYQPHLGGGRTIFQTIFLDDNIKDCWTVKNISDDSVLKCRTTRQFAHTWTHFAFWVPFVRFLQGKSHTWYCGSFTLFNTHEIAVMSGLAVAERLGAPYPFAHDKLARDQFDMYLKVAHGFFVQRSKQNRCR